MNTRNDQVKAAILSGDFTLPSDLDEESSKEWHVFKAWNTAMKNNGVVTPSDMEGVDGILELMRLQSLLSPYRLRDGPMLGEMADKEKVELRAKAEADLVQWLEKHGF